MFMRGPICYLIGAYLIVGPQQMTCHMMLIGHCWANRLAACLMVELLGQRHTDMCHSG